MAMPVGRPRALFGAFSLIVASSLSASAGIVTLESVESSSLFGDPDYSSPVTIESPELLFTRAGPFRMNNLTTAETDLVAWCIDLTQRVSVGQTQYQTGLQLVSDERLNLLDRLFTQYFHEVQDEITGAAMQVAVWEIVTETARDATPDQTLTLNVHQGQFVVAVDTPTQQANAWLDSIAVDETAGGFTFETLFSDSAQDLLIAKALPEPVPLPAAMWMLLSAMGGAAGLRKLRKTA